LYCCDLRATAGHDGLLFMNCISLDFGKAATGQAVIELTGA
jgi:hypothetical protein